MTLPGISEKRVQAHAQLVMTQHAQQNGPETRCRMRMSQWKVLGRSHTCCSSGRRQGAVRLMTRPSPPGCGCAGGLRSAPHAALARRRFSACVCTDQPLSRGCHVAFSSSSSSKQGGLRSAPQAALARRPSSACNCPQSAFTQRVPCRLQQLLILKARTSQQRSTCCARSRASLHASAQISLQAGAFMSPSAALHFQSKGISAALRMLRSLARASLQATARNQPSCRVLTLTPSSRLFLSVRNS